MYDVRVGREEGISLYLFESLRHRFLPKRAADLLESIEGGGGSILNQVDIGEAALEELKLAFAPNQRDQ